MLVLENCTLINKMSII